MLKNDDWFSSKDEISEQPPKHVKTVHKCYVLLARLMTQNQQTVFRNSIVETDSTRELEPEIEEVISWIKICEEHGDFTMIEHTLKK